MNKFTYLVIGILVYAISGCGQNIITTTQNPLGSDPNGPGVGRSIVVLPFADYSTGKISSAQRRNMLISENFSDQFNGYGFSMPIDEDVFNYLVQQKIIQVTSTTTVNTTSLDDEITNPDWSSTMRSEIQRYRNKVVEDSAEAAASSSGVHSLTKHRVAQLGRHFKADYVVRGRILEFKTRDEARWEPWKKGVLPFVFGSTNRIINGFASSESYDARNEGLTGALFGGIIAHNNSNWPWDEDQSFLGMTDGTANTITWAATSYAVGSEVTHKSGKVDQAVVQMRVWVQETLSGNVIWTNRVRVAVSPESVMADNQYDLLFNKAIEKAVSELSQHFVQYGL